MVLNHLLSRRGRFHLGEQTWLDQKKTPSLYLVIPSLTGYPQTKDGLSPNGKKKTSEHRKKVPVFTGRMDLTLARTSFPRRRESILPCFPKMLGVMFYCTLSAWMGWSTNSQNPNKLTGRRSASPTRNCANVVGNDFKQLSLSYETSMLVPFLNLLSLQFFLVMPSLTGYPQAKDGILFSPILADKQEWGVS